ncbi:MAG: helix-turn-helix domain-containing protein [Clostridia bacterium]|nr:helix-turn-helix domain-containing protein [Clostridia bacterium]
MTEKIQAEIKSRFYVDVTCKKATQEQLVKGEKYWTEGNGIAFRFTYKGSEYVGMLDGETESNRTIAALLVNYFEGEVDRFAELSKNERWRSVLLGEGTVRATYRFLSKFSIKNGACFALAISFSRLIDEGMETLMQYCETSSDSVVKMDDKTLALVRYVLTEEGEEYHSSYEYAEFIVQLMKEELGVDVLVGFGSTVKDVKDVSISYAQASGALRYAETFSVRGKVHSYREFVLVKMVEELSPHKQEEYRSELMDAPAQEVFEDEELLATAEEFLLSNLHVSETSRNLYMHRNTLSYRLDKIEKSTGLNIRQFSDAMSFRVLSILYKLLKK